MVVPNNTPDNITKLGPYDVFVFGSNLEGRHDGGAAKLALEKFGAIYGKGVGPQGQSYAIPTMGGLPQIRMYTLDLMEYARTHPNLTFYLTRIGCGIAGYKDGEIAPLFKTFELQNLVKPKGW